VLVTFGCLTRHFRAGTDGQTQPVKSGLESRLHTFAKMRPKRVLYLWDHTRPYHIIQFASMFDLDTIAKRILF